VPGDSYAAGDTDIAGSDLKWAARNSTVAVVAVLIAASGGFFGS
jgi:hypothetical protein